MTSEITPRAVAQIYVKLDGRAVPEAMLDDLIEATIESSVLLPDMATIVFLDSDFRWSDADAIRLGAQLEIELGASELKRLIFKGEITAIEPSFSMDGSTLISVRGYDHAHRLNRGRKSRTFLQMTDQDIARAIARDHGLRADVGTRPSNQHEYVIQNNQTDLEFLQARAANIGFEVQVQGDTLFFKPPPSTPGETIDLNWGDNLLSFSAELTLSEQVSEVEVRSWDPISKQQIVGTASRGDTTTAVAERSSGGDLAKRAFNDSPRMIIVREQVHSQVEAEAIAQAALNEIEQARITAEGEAIGDPRLTLGSELNVRNVGTRFSGTYSVASITHHYGQDGYRIRFTVSGRRPTDIYGLIEAPRSAGLQLMTGIVTNNSDDRDRGRVKVKLPTLGDDIESHWCRIVAPGAGPDRGIEFLPEVDDEVLLIGDARQLFVLGGLWNQPDAPPEVTSSVVSGGSVERRIIKSRSGHVITLDDSTGSPGISIVDSTGDNRIAIDTQNNRLEIAVAGDLSIEAGGAIQIRAERDITIEAGTDLSGSARGGAVSLEAATQLSVKGNASASLEGGGRAEVKAPTVNIGP